MSRESAASQSTVVQGAFARPEPPPELSGPQQAVWRSVVDAKPPSFFDAAQFPFLADYCRAVVLQDELTKNLCASQINDFDKLAKLKTHLGTKLRITNQSRYNPDKAGTLSRPTNRAQNFGSVVSPIKPPGG